MYTPCIYLTEEKLFRENRVWIGKKYYFNGNKCHELNL